MALRLFFGSYFFSSMAWLGQMSTPPHSLSLSELITLALPSSSKAAPSGHTATHVPQPLHFSLLMVSSAISHIMAEPRRYVNITPQKHDKSWPTGKGFCSTSFLVQRSWKLVGAPLAPASTDFDPLALPLSKGELVGVVL